MILAQITQQFIDREKTDVINGLTDWPIPLMGAILAIGFLTMTLVEPFKAGSRGSFHRFIIWNWLIGFTHQKLWRYLVRTNFTERKFKIEKPSPSLSKERIEEIGRRIKDVLPVTNNWESLDKSEKNAMDQLILLAAGGNELAFFNLPIENLCGQISLASQSMLESPSSYQSAIFHLLGRSNRVMDVLDDFFTVVDYDTTNTKNLEMDEKTKSFMAARSRIAAHIQRNIDSLQINTTYEWKNVMKTISLICSFVVAILGCSLFASNVHLVTLIIVVLFTGYSSAYLASFYNDLFGTIRTAKK